MIRLAVLLAIALSCTGARASVVYGDLMPLMEAARRDGRAEGVLGGAAAERMREMGIDRPIEAVATRLYRLKDPECARVRVELSQKGVLLPGESAPRDRHNHFELNWCPGGRPPVSPDPAEGERPALPAGLAPQAAPTQAAVPMPAAGPALRSPAPASPKTGRSSREKRP